MLEPFQLCKVVICQLVAETDAQRLQVLNVVHVGQVGTREIWPVAEV